LPDRPLLRRFYAGLLVTALAGQAAADAPRLCGLIAWSAREADLPAPFLARLIWTESRFDVRALSPKGAQGVAQFMPGTAALRGLADPYDPAQAIPASAAYLAALRTRFGNLGLAAAAYNAGEARVAAWLAGRGGLPGETRAYVLSITGESAEAHRAAGRAGRPVAPLAPDTTFRAACEALPVMAAA
jgi:soluble lytic murein transglycosylase-like protein